MSEQPQQARDDEARSEQVPGVEVPISAIHLGDTTFQYRVETDTKGIKESIEAAGQQTPVHLLGRKPPYRVIDGFRRVTALKELQRSTVRAIVHQTMSEEAAQVFAFTQNVVRRNLAPIEEANAMYRAMRRGVKPADLAALFKINERQVQRRLELLKFSDTIKKLIDGNELTVAHGKLLDDFEVKEPVAWKRRIEKEKLSSKALKRALEKDFGSHQRGRLRTYWKRSTRGVRVYGFSIAFGAPQGERNNVIKALEDVVAALRAE